MNRQWGNVLTLSAVYRDPILSTLVEKELPEQKFRFLFNKTIAFLSLVATPKSAIMTDLKILQHIGGVLGLRTVHTPQGSNATSSFSSTSTAGGDVSMTGN